MACHRLPRLSGTRGPTHLSETFSSCPTCYIQPVPIFCSLPKLEEVIQAVSNYASTSSATDTTTIKLIFVVDDDEDIGYFLIQVIHQATANHAIHHDTAQKALEEIKRYTPTCLSWTIIYPI